MLYQSVPQSLFMTIPSYWDKLMNQLWSWHNHFYCQKCLSLKCIIHYMVTLVILLTDVNLEMPNLSRVFKQKNSEVWSCEKSGLEIVTWRSSAYLLQLQVRLPQKEDKFVVATDQVWNGLTRVSLPREKDVFNNIKCHGEVS